MSLFKIGDKVKIIKGQVDTPKNLLGLTGKIYKLLTSDHQLGNGKTLKAYEVEIPGLGVNTIFEDEMAYLNPKALNNEMLKLLEQFDKFKAKYPRSYKTLLAHIKE